MVKWVPCLTLKRELWTACVFLEKIDRALVEQQYMTENV